MNDREEDFEKQWQKMGVDDEAIKGYSRQIYLLGRIDEMARVIRVLEARGGPSERLALSVIGAEE